MYNIGYCAVMSINTEVWWAYPESIVASACSEQCTENTTLV